MLRKTLKSMENVIAGCMLVRSFWKEKLKIKQFQTSISSIIWRSRWFENLGKTIENLKKYLIKHV